MVRRLRETREIGAPSDALGDVADLAGPAHRLAADLVAHLTETGDISAALKARQLREVLHRIALLAADTTKPIDVS